MTETHKLRVFLCHSSQDKPIVRELYQRLNAEGWIDPWLDAKKLLPGQDWRASIEEAVETADNVIICLSNHSVSKDGYIQKEMRYAQEISLEKPEGTIFLIPLRLEECEVPRGLRFFQWTNYFGENKKQSYEDLLESLRANLEKKTRKETECKPPKPIINTPKSLPIIAGEIFRLDCESSGNMYSELCKYQWQVGWSSKMEISRLVSETLIPSLDQKNNIQGFYYYQVRVEQNECWSDWSKSVGIPVKADLGMPIIIYPSDKDIIDGDFILKWSDVIGAIRYVIEYQTYDSSTLIWSRYNQSPPRESKNTWECEIKNNTPGKYKIRIVAYDKLGNVSRGSYITVKIAGKSIFGLKI